MRFLLLLFLFSCTTYQINEKFNYNLVRDNEHKFTTRGKVKINDNEIKIKNEKFDVIGYTIDSQIGCISFLIKSQKDNQRYNFVYYYLDNDNLYGRKYIMYKNLQTNKTIILYKI